MNNNRLQVRRVHAQYLVSSEHPSPQLLQDRLDDEIRRNLTQVLSAAFSPWFSETDPSIWFVRRLEIDVAVNAERGGEQLTRVLATQIARELGATLQDGGDQNNVIRFSSFAAYLSRFLSDLAAGDAWGRWYYESFAGLRLLPTSAALRTAVCNQPETGREALSRFPPGELKQVLRALTRQDGRLVLDSLAGAFAAGDEFECCQRAWNVWQKIGADCFNGLEEWGQALYLYLVAGRDQENTGLNLKRGALALLRLSSKLAASSTAQSEKLLSALIGDGLASLYETAGADAETLLPLLSCPPAWVRDVVYLLKMRQTGQARTDSATTEPRDTSFGGAFLLLPVLDELPLDEATHDWLHAEEAASISLVRFLLLIKLCGQEHAGRVFYDPLLRDLLLIPPAVSFETLSDWQSRITHSQRQRFLQVLLNWQSSRRAITGAKQILASTTLNGRPLIVLIDSSRGLWLLAQRYSPRRPRRLIDSLRSFVSELESNEGLLLCDPSLLEMLWPEFPTLKMVSLADTEQAEDNPISNILARLDQLSDDVSHLALPNSFKLSPSLDLAMSVAAQQVMRAFAWRLPGFAGSNLPYLSRNFLEFGASVEEELARRVVRLGRPPLQLILGITGMTRQTYRLSWLDERPLALFQET
jgi:hypothetical protein